MAQLVCPWWLGYLLACPIRRLLQKPEAIVGPYLKPGMTVLEVGPGMGFFTLPMARLMKDNGRVVALDIQPKMLAVLSKKAAKAGLAERVETRVVKEDSLGVSDLNGAVDFALLFAVVHEVPDSARLWKEVAASMKQNGMVLFSEPSGHVSEEGFARSLAEAARAGLQVVDRPVIRGGKTAVLKRA